MSRAFVKEDAEVAEPSGRRRSPSGLPPGAVNYLTARGAALLRADAQKEGAEGDEDSAGEIKRILASATVVEPPEEARDLVTFGATVTVRCAGGQTQTFRIVGADETGFWPDAVSWVSPIGRALLGAELGARVSLGDSGENATVERIEHL